MNTTWLYVDDSGRQAGVVSWVSAVSQMVALALASHRRCGSSCWLHVVPGEGDGGAACGGGQGGASVWISFVRRLWHRFVMSTRDHFVLDLTMPHQEYKAIYFGVSRILMSVTTPVTLHQTILGKPPCYNGTTGRWIGPNHYCTIDPVPAGIEFGIVDIRSDTREFAIPAPWISASNANPRWAVTCFKWLSGFQITIGKLKDMSIQESITLYHQVAEGPGGTIWGAHFDSFHPDEVIITWSDAFHLDRCSLIVVHLSKSFSGRSLSIVSSTKFLLGSHAGIIVYAVGRFVITNKVHCFALKTTFSGDLVHLVTEGTGTVQPIKSKVNHDLQVSALSPNCFCISTMTGTCAELWDCNNTQQPLRVIEFTTVYGPQYDYGMAVASSGFLFLCHHNQIRVVDALPGMCCICADIPGLFSIPHVSHF